MREGWKHVQLTRCIEHKVIPMKIQRKQFQDSGLFPIVSQEKDLINGYCSDESALIKVDSPIVLFGDHTQVLKYIDFDFVVGADGTKLLEPKNFLNAKYFYYYLMAKPVESLGYARHYRLLKDLIIEFPDSIVQQKRIVAILDEAFAAIETAVANTRKNLANARELFDSYLNGVFSRKVDGWVEKRLGDVCDLMTGGTPSKTKPEFFENGNIKWLVSGDIHQREIFNCKGRITESGLKNSNAKYLPINSVMIALNGQGKTRGSVALLRTKATCNQSLVSIYPKNTVRILPEYIQINLQGRYQEIRHITGDSGNDRRGLNMKLVRNIKIPIAPPTEQQIIVSSLNEIESEVRHLEEIYQQKLDSLGELEQSILHKAFSGELTDGADEILEEAGV